MVLVIERLMIMIHKTKDKFETKWEEPFIVEIVYSNELCRLINQDGDRIMMSVNSEFLNYDFI